MKAHVMELGIVVDRKKKIDCQNRWALLTYFLTRTALLPRAFNMLSICNEALIMQVTVLGNNDQHTKARGTILNTKYNE